MVISPLSCRWGRSASFSPGRQFVCGYTTLAGFSGEIQLHANVDGWQPFRTLFAEPPAVFQAAQGMHPREVLCDGPGLVGLDAADKMPFDIAILQQGIFAGHPAGSFGKRLLSCLPDLANLAGRAGLAYSNESYAGWISVTR